MSKRATKKPAAAVADRAEAAAPVTAKAATSSSSTATNSTKPVAAAAATTTTDKSKGRGRKPKDGVAPKQTKKRSADGVDGRGRPVGATKKFKSGEAPTDVPTFLAAVEVEKIREDCGKLCNIMKAIVNDGEATMWGSSVVSFGKGPGESFCLGFSPRKQYIVIYLPCGVAREDALLKKLGKHKTGKCCLYINKLADVDDAVLKQVLQSAANAVKSAVEQVI